MHFLSGEPKEFQAIARKQRVKEKTTSEPPFIRPALVTECLNKYRSQGTVRWAPIFGARAALGSGIYLNNNHMVAG
jgi:hypothetical protein